MNDAPGYAVFFFAPALEALGDAIKPYLRDGEAGPHLQCREVDTAGAFIEMTLHDRTPDGSGVEMELMVPANMVRMIVSAHIDGDFGFHNRPRPVLAAAIAAATEAAPVPEPSPPVPGAAQPAGTPAA